MHHHPKPPRPGFTLVELAVVIGIISLLAAALLPAIYGAVSKAKETKIAIEIATIGDALERYKLEYGEYPPDFAELAYMKASLVDDTVIATRAQEIIDTHLSRVFRRRSSRDYPRLSDGNPHVELLANLNPGNALVLWLGGFTNDPTLPLSGASARKPIFEFDKSRFADPPAMNDPAAYYVQAINSAGSWTNDTWDTSSPAGIVGGYYPSGVANNASYVYYRAADSGYDWAVNWVGELLSINSAASAIPSPPYPSNSTSGYAAPDKFQLISAGRDGEYGVDSSTVVTNSNQNWEWQLGSTSLADRKNDRTDDNLCTAWDGSNLEDFLDK